ncbi:MAG TPA: PHP domain-containing protein [Acidimicrobiia bacterium]|jgi:putative hydrolase
MEPLAALERIAFLLEQQQAPTYKVDAFRKASGVVGEQGPDALRALAEQGRLRELPGVGDTTARVITEALEGKTPSYLERLELDSAETVDEAASEVRQWLRGDLHLHSNWSDGGSPIETMARTAMELGHEYIALTDHSPRLSIAHGLSAERLREQLDILAALNEELAPFRVLTGIEVDILDDGSLDQEDELLAELDVVVASSHSELRMEERAMTARMIGAVSNPHVDILGHCTGRLIKGRGRKESTFDAELVFAACAEFDTAVEVNCRPERLDPPRRLLALVDEMGCKISIDTDAHAPGQLSWHPYGCTRVAETGITRDRVVNALPADELLAWTASHDG